LIELPNDKPPLARNVHNKIIGKIIDARSNIILEYFCGENLNNAKK
jgi:hypothetical protein